MFKKGGGGIMSKVNKLKTKIWLHAILFYNLKCTLTFFIKRILSFFYQDLSNIYRKSFNWKQTV